jgi:hypothetical protein
MTTSLQNYKETYPPVKYSNSSKKLVEEKMVKLEDMIQEWVIRTQKPIIVTKHISYDKQEDCWIGVVSVDNAEEDRQDI